MKTSRREFLAGGVSSATLLATGISLPRFLARTARAATSARDERVLVVVQLTGGNDGLNTVIPFADDLYHRARPTLRVPAERVLRLNYALGLHPEMASLRGLHDDGCLATITNVGYPNPDRSHFRSMDIWHTASLAPEKAESGWLGRCVDHCCALAHGADDAPPALHLDDESLPLALKAAAAVPSIHGIEAFRLNQGGANLAEQLAAARNAASEELLFVQRVAVASCATAARIEHVEQAHAAGGVYPNYGLAQRLSQIAQLITAGFGARIYYTSIGGFDTHARQALAHGPLLRELSESIAAFTRDLKSRGVGERVVTMTFSEFGRRVNENGSLGTDHGAAAPIFLAGPAVKAGVIGGAPDLANLADGDVRHTIDFRQVYASVLRDWLEISPQTILGEEFRGARILNT